MKQRILMTVLSIAAALVLLTAATAFAVLPAQVQLPGNKIPQFAQALPRLNVFTPNDNTGIWTLVAGPGELKLNMLEFKANMLPPNFIPGYTGTWTFGYRVGPTTAPINAVDTAVGPVIVAVRGAPTQIRYINNLTADNIYWRNWTDQSLHSAFHQIYGQMMPTLGDPAHYLGPVPAVPHLHGGEVPPVLDGGPEGYFLSNVGDFTDVVNNGLGAAYYAGTDVAGGGGPAAPNESIYRYPNSQEAAPLWFHDHLLGGTRLNATYAGLAGAYPIIDPSLALPAGMNPVGLNNGTLDLTSILGPTGDNTELLIPLVIQDRMFDTTGQLFFPNVGVNPEHLYWVPEFVGDTIIVNGKAWPFLTVDRKRYRFYLINGSNSRPYDMYLIDRVTGIKGPPMWVIATDGGYLDNAVLINPNATGADKKRGVQKSLMMMPGERYEMIIDFNDPTWVAAINAAYAALGIPVPNPLKLTLRNTGITVDGPPNANTDGRIMEFQVSANAPLFDAGFNPAAGAVIRTGGQRIKRLVDPVAGTLAAAVGTPDKVRELTLNEVPGPGGPLEALVNNSKWNGLLPDNVTPILGSVLVNGNWITERPKEGDIEVWEIVNLTADSHPIHLHGVQFQILNRQVFDTKRFNAAYALAFGGAYIPAAGPPFNPSVPIAGKLGGNPDVTPFLAGPAAPPLNYEAGWKDTAIMHPGEVTRIAVRFAPQDVAVGTRGCFSFDPTAPSTNGEPGYYVWHCHITDHEDNEMMRPYLFQPDPVNCPSSPSRGYLQGTDY